MAKIKKILPNETRSKKEDRNWKNPIRAPNFESQSYRYYPW
jgi:hypothetical protein